jgi:lipopolysaccharide export system protein LptA
MKCFPGLLALVLVSGAATWAHAERADRSKPMNIEADSLTYDDKQKLSVFTGNVVLTKGTIIMRGGKLEVRQDEAGNQFGVLYASCAKRAFFHQKREGVDEYMEGEGQTIHYDSKADTVRLVQQAEIRRLMGTRVADTITGSDILYNNTTEIVTVDGGARTSGEGAASAVNKGRVRAVLTPQPEATGKPAPGSQQPLQPSDRLNKERQ